MNEYDKLISSRKIWEMGRFNAEEIVNNAETLLFHQNLSDDPEYIISYTKRRYPHFTAKLASRSSSKIIETVSCFIKSKSVFQDRIGDQVGALACIETLNTIINERKSLKYAETYTISVTTVEYCRLVKNLISVVCKLFHNDNLDFKSFTQMYHSLENIPLEILWLFQESELIESTSYIMKKLCHPQDILKFTTSLSVIICNGGGDEISEKVSVGLLSSLVAVVYGSTAEKMSQDALSSPKAGLKIVLSSVLHKVNEQLLPAPKDNVKKGPKLEGGKGINEELNPVDIYNLLASSSVLGGPKSQIIHLFFSDQLAETLKFSPDVTLNQAFMRQNEWSFTKTTHHLRKMLTSLLAPFEAKDALDIIQKILKVGEVNWRIVLTYFSIYTVRKDGCGSYMTEFVTSLVQEAFAKKCRESLILALLTARQCGTEGCGFPSYAEWFGSMFGARGTWGNPAGADTSRISTSSFRFLMALITDLVPMESVPGLRAHIACPPQSPASASARAILSDYLHLAKTRLSDFGVVLADQGGLFQSNKLGSEDAMLSGRDLVKSEVEVVLSHFKKTGNILRTVLEASVFRKRYLEQTFLPELLKPRLLPAEPDTRMKVIEILASKGLISAAMHTNYLKNCEEENRKTLNNEGTASEVLVCQPILFPGYFSKTTTLQYPVSSIWIHRYMVLALYTGIKQGPYLGPWY